ncbi:hypothetical protein [Sphingobacterium sp. UDSM-2020]|nr:hypothetical protein [Sphingobacterium sp. UDSM-2020]QQD13973.1 hypothetical protein JAZ75_00045 [Sphingobacterium sp. UDSM-2020]
MSSLRSVTEAQIRFALKQSVTGHRMEEVCRKPGINGSTYYVHNLHIVNLDYGHWIQQEKPDETYPINFKMP